MKNNPQTLGLGEQEVSISFWKCLESRNCSLRELLSGAAAFISGCSGIKATLLIAL